MLVTVTASSRSNAIAPSPSQSGRYAEAKGTIESLIPIGAKPSASVVTMWRIEYDKRQQGDVSVQAVDHEPRPALAADALDVEDAEHHRRAEKDQRDDPGPPGQEPVRARGDCENKGAHRETLTLSPAGHPAISPDLARADRRGGPEVGGTRASPAPSRGARLPRYSRSLRPHRWLRQRSRCASPARALRPNLGSMMWCRSSPSGPSPAPDLVLEVARAPEAEADRLPLDGNRNRWRRLRRCR